MPLKLLSTSFQVSHVEERKNDQIEHIKKSHEKAFNEIKNYYNDITLNNLAMIATLKEEIKERDVKIERSEKQVFTLYFTLAMIIIIISSWIGGYNTDPVSSLLKHVIYGVRHPLKVIFRSFHFGKVESTMDSRLHGCSTAMVLHPSEMEFYTGHTLPDICMESAMIFVWHLSAE